MILYEFCKSIHLINSFFYWYPPKSCKYATGPTNKKAPCISGFAIFLFSPLWSVFTNCGDFCLGENCNVEWW